LLRSRNSRLRTAGTFAALLLLLAACGGDAGDTQDVGGGEEADGGGEAVTLQVSAVDNSFEPASLSAPAGTEVTVEVTNDGNNPHTFTIDDPEVDTSTIAAGESADATFTMPDTSVTFYCAIHGENTMAGTLDPS